MNLSLSSLAWSRTIKRSEVLFNASIIKIDITLLKKSPQAGPLLLEPIEGLVLTYLFYIYESNLLLKYLMFHFSTILNNNYLDTG